MKEEKKKRTLLGKTRQDVHVQRNPIEDALLNLRHFLRENRPVVIRGAVIGILILFALSLLYGFVYWSSSKGNEVLYLAREQLAFSQNNAKVTEEKKKEKIQRAVSLLKMLDSSHLYMFGSASDLAAYELGKVYILAEDFEKAKESFLSFADGHKGHYLEPIALLKAAYCLERQKKYSEALKIYKRVHQDVRKGIYSKEAQYGIGRMQELLGNLLEARNAYRKLAMEDNGMSFYYASQARKRLFLLYDTRTGR